MEKNYYHSIMENLKDAGCDKKEIIEFIELYEKEKISEELGFLENYRKALMNRIHMENKKLDCLDYLIYTIKQRNEAEKHI